MSIPSQPNPVTLTKHSRLFYHYKSIFVYVCQFCQFLSPEKFTPLWTDCIYYTVNQMWELLYASLVLYLKELYPNWLRFIRHELIIPESTIQCNPFLIIRAQSARAGSKPYTIDYRGAMYDDTEKKSNIGKKMNNTRPICYHKWGNHYTVL